MKKKHVLILFGLIVIAIHCSRQNNKKAYRFDSYKKWKMPVNKILDYTVPGHGKSFRRIYANPVSYAPVVTIENKKVTRVEYKNGSIIVKEVFAAREDVDEKNPQLTVMIKDSTNPTAINGWVYIVQTPEGKRMQINGNMCVACHEAANDTFEYFDGNKEDIFRDYIFVPLFKLK